MPLPLQTRRLVLRPFVATDAEALHERMFGDPVVISGSLRIETGDGASWNA